MKKSMLTVLCMALMCHLALCCTELRLSSSRFKTRLFTSLSISRTRAAGLTSGRPAYISIDDDNAEVLYLYHCISGADKEGNKADGLGRWVINDVLGKTETALSFQNSWSVMPTLSTVLADNSPNMHWKIHDGSSWVSDEEIQVTCSKGADADTSIYFAVEGLPWKLSGFFIEHDLFEGTPVYSHIGAEDEKQTYLYKQQDQWMIGHEVGSDRGLAYTTAPDVMSALELAAAGGAAATDWLFVTNRDPVWQPFAVHIITGNAEHDVYTRLQQHRSVSADSGYMYTLRNGLPLPAVGLGTGGIDWQRSSEVLTEALHLGYRLLDSAREYGNEKQIGDLLTSPSSPAPRAEVFIMSKVWPTFLGFIPTSREINKSLQALQSAYVDLYLLHWPTCQKSISWMHCETTVDPTGNWKQSWNALERAYAEGRVASIGVSNFDTQQLGEFWGFGSVRPHLVQNHGEPGKLDIRVREWCSEHSAIYMPYAHQRNMKFLPSSMRGSIQQVGHKYNVSAHVVTSRFFYQTGAAIVPRSSQSAHLKENLRDVSTFTLTEEEMASMGWDLSAMKKKAKKTEL